MTIIIIIAILWKKIIIIRLCHRNVIRCWYDARVNNQLIRRLCVLRRLRGHRTCSLISDDADDWSARDCLCCRFVIISLYIIHKHYNIIWYIPRITRRRSSIINALGHCSLNNNNNIIPTWEMLKKKIIIILRLPCRRRRFVNPIFVWLFYYFFFNIYFLCKVKFFAVVVVAVSKIGSIKRSSEL